TTWRAFTGLRGLRAFVVEAFEPGALDGFTMKTAKATETPGGSAQHARSPKSILRVLRGEGFWVRAFVVNGLGLRPPKGVLSTTLRNGYQTACRPRVAGHEGLRRLDGGRQPRSDGAATGHRGPAQVAEGDE